MYESYLGFLWADGGHRLCVSGRFSQTLLSPVGDKVAWTLLHVLLIVRKGR